jgi:hypothetical protein
MAENESLDLKSPQAQRWNAVRDAARKGASREKVGDITRTRLYQALRKSIKQLKRRGVSVGDFLENRGNPRLLRHLVRQTEGHPYAKMLVCVLNANPDLERVECLRRWVSSVLERVFDQIDHGLAGTEYFPNFFLSQEFLGQILQDLEADIQRIATNLDKNPEWEPKRAASKGAPAAEPTEELLSMSLLIGGSKR